MNTQLSSVGQSIVRRDAAEAGAKGNLWVDYCSLYVQYSTQVVYRVRQQSALHLAPHLARQVPESEGYRLSSEPEGRGGGAVLAMCCGWAASLRRLAGGCAS